MRTTRISLSIAGCIACMCRLRMRCAERTDCPHVRMAHIWQVDKALVDGADEYLQLTNMLATIMRALK